MLIEIEIFENRHLPKFLTKNISVRGLFLFLVSNLRCFCSNRKTKISKKNLDRKFQSQVKLKNKSVFFFFKSQAKKKYWRVLSKKKFIFFVPSLNFKIIWDLRQQLNLFYKTHRNILFLRSQVRFPATTNLPQWILGRLEPRTFRVHCFKILPWMVREAIGHLLIWSHHQ